MSVLQDYHDEIVSGRLKTDAAQERGARALQILQDQIDQADQPLSFYQKILRVVGCLPSVQQGVYLYGPVGRGKTRLMNLFFQALSRETPKERVHFHEFMLSVHAFLHGERQAGGVAGVDDVLPKFAAQVAARTRVLCFDEFHVTDVADAMILSRLMTTLFDAGVYVVMTSNYPPCELYKNGLQRELFLPFIDLIQNRMNVVAIEGPYDYRQARLQGRPVYFYPNGARAQTCLAEIFSDLTDDEQGTVHEIVVMGRHISVAHAARGVAWISFLDWCEKPMAAQDYLALARRYHTILIDRVPRLNYDRHNETKRFMIMVDILYEHQRRLVIAADAALDQIFIHNEHAFEFKRTLSRLAEMQSQSYLQSIRDDLDPI